MTLQDLKTMFENSNYEISDIQQALEAVKKDGYALQYVKEQTPEIALEAVKKDGGALQFVKSYIFNQGEKEISILEIEQILGYSIKIINKEK